MKKKLAYNCYTNAKDFLRYENWTIMYLYCLETIQFPIKKAMTWDRVSEYDIYSTGIKTNN